MTVFFILLSLGLAGILWQYVQKVRRTVWELQTALRGRRRLLFTESSSGMKRLGLEGLVTEVNALIDQSNAYAEETVGYSNQIEATLGSIQEAVLIFDGERTIEFANESAQRLFHQGRRLTGERLESVLRSSSLLEFLEQYQQNPNAPLTQVSVERRGESLWFEVSCSRVCMDAGEPSESTLLVLHDITRLKSLEMVRRDFVANVSHELRTPLTIIKGFAETLVADNATLPVAARARFLDKILNSAQRLHVLVEDLLTLSRLESKPEQIDTKVQSLRQVLEETAENYRARLNGTAQSIDIEYDERVGDFAFDRFRIQQVVDNLVENVFRYAPEFTRLTLRVAYDPKRKHVACEVHDDGPGIPSKDLPHIFERFYRVDKGRSRERGGTGLGLSIMKHIIQLHGGHVFAQSELGVGTRIHFHLPYVQHPKELTAAG
jgi:signal transduction histidine kinase